jgi:hypothetical protein
VFSNCDGEKMSGSSSHGGAREGAGRKPKFRTDDETTSVTVPKAHKSEMQTAIDLVDDLIARGFTIEQIRTTLLKIKKDAKTLVLVGDSGCQLCAKDAFQRSPLGV